MAFLFDPFSPLAISAESVTFLSTEDFGGGNVIHVRIVGTDLDYNATTGAFGGTAVITAIELVDATGGNVLQTVTLGSTTAAADATAFLAQVAAAYADFPNLNLPVFDDLEVVFVDATSFRLDLFSAGTPVGYIEVTGTGFIDDTLAGTVSTFEAFANSGTSLGALTAPAVPAPLSALVYPFGAQDGLYYVLTSGDDTVDATAAANGVLNHDLDPGAGTNTISAIFGGTLLTYKESTEAVTIDLGAGTATRSGGDIDTFSNIDLAEGSALDDTLLGSGGNNFLAGRDGDDTLGGGRDTVFYSFLAAIDTNPFDFDTGLNVTLTAQGTGTIEGSTSANDFTDNFDGIEVIIGSLFADTFTGAANATNHFGGMDGSDTFNGHATSSDTVDYSNDEIAGGGGAVTVNLTTNLATDGFGDTDTLVSVEHVIGTRFGDTFNGNASGNIFDGGAGDDTMTGLGGNDTYVVDDGADFVDETAVGSGGDDLVRSWITFALGTNFERLELLGGADLDGTGNTLNNTITGNSGSNTLDGGDGNDSLAGAGGADTLIGGAGNDTFVLGDGTDSVDDVSGTDTITSTINRSLALFSTIENLILLGTATQGTGNAGRNSITGNSSANLLDGGVNIDTLIGGSGNDTYVVTTGDVLTETSGQGTDTVRASQSYVLASSANIEKLETVSLTATTAINLTGNALAQSITGNNGANKITGGGGKDTMSGKLGKDTFDFNAISDMTKSSSTTDVITDFTKGQDRIDLSTIDASSKAAGNQAFTLLTTKGAAFTGVAGQLHYKALGSNTLIEGDLNGDKKADFALLLLGSKTLAKTDFIL